MKDALRTVAKLLRLARDRSNVHEASAAREKANAIALKHGIDLARLTELAGIDLPGRTQPLSGETWAVVPPSDGKRWFQLMRQAVDFGIGSVVQVSGTPPHCACCKGPLVVYHDAFQDVKDMALRRSLESLAESLAAASRVHSGERGLCIRCHDGMRGPRIVPRILAPKFREHEGALPG
jgi:hypothetical protein